MIVAVTKEEFTTRLVELCLKSGMRDFPRKRRDQHILMNSVALTLDPTATYSESEITDRLIFWLTDIGQSIDFDHVSLRRLLVDEGYLMRDNAGTQYRVRHEGSNEMSFEAEVDNVDVYTEIGLAKKALLDRKRRHAPAE